MFNVENWWVALGTAVLASLTAGTILRLIFRRPKNSVKFKIEFESHPVIPLRESDNRALSPGEKRDAPAE
jgi:hypothetical protein